MLRMTTPQLPQHESEPASRRALARTSDISARLKRETASEHAAIERASGILHQGLTREQYRRYLERWFGFVAPFEAELCRREVWGTLGLSPAALSSHAGSPETSDRVVAGARATFRAFTRWLERP